MKIGIVLSTKEEEKAYNAFRFGVAGLKKGYTVEVFLLGEGVEAEDLKSERFNVTEQLNLFRNHKGTIKACGSCLASRQKEESMVCPASSMADLLTIVEESDKIVTFG